MPIQNLPDESSQIKKLLEKNLELTEEIFKMAKSIKSFVIHQRIFGILKLLIIVVPIILGIIYLPPLLSGITEQYKDLLGIKSGAGGNITNILDLLKGGAGGENLKNVDINKLPPEAQKYLK
ncbi:hypothetical protein KKC04_03350 [Patescibacteria group bacterium]|nr:hypothetical protein [Patescibacteria group bacterium]